MEEKMRQLDFWPEDADPPTKSELVRQMAEELGLPIIEFKLADCEPIDLRGYSFGGGK
jgi:hypothetical protein